MEETFFWRFPLVADFIVVGVLQLNGLFFYEFVVFISRDELKFLFRESEAGHDTLTLDHYLEVVVLVDDILQDMLKRTLR